MVIVRENPALDGPLHVPIHLPSGRERAAPSPGVDRSSRRPRCGEPGSQSWEERAPHTQLASDLPVMQRPHFSGFFSSPRLKAS